MFGNIRENVFYKVLFPVAIYFVLNNLLYSAITYANNDFMGNAIPVLICAAIASAITLVVMIFFYRNANVYTASSQFGTEHLLKEILLLVGIVALGIILNLIITNVLPYLPEVITGSYKETAQLLNSGDVVSKIIANVILAPILEELVFRGIVCGELEKKVEVVPTVVISSLLFAVVHINPVQMVYAFVLGLLLAYVYEETHKLWLCVAGHAILNLVVVITSLYMN